MSIFVKINRATGEVMERRRAPSMERAFDKPTVWLEVIEQPQPAFDQETERLAPAVLQSDLSNMAAAVKPIEKRVEDWRVVPLNAGELAEKKDQRIAATDSKLARLVEGLFVAIATGAPLERATFPAAVWDKINERRALRGQGPI